MSFCAKCGTKMHLNDDFCPECGARVNKATSESSVQTSAVPQSDIGIAPGLPKIESPAALKLTSTVEGVRSAADELAKTHFLGEVSKLLLNPVFFVIAYTVFMTPTYILPYVGSNSSLINAMGVAAGAGLHPALLVHVGVLAILVLLTWLRGRLIQKHWLLALPIAASLFDLLPGLSLIPMVPTVLHIVTIVLGVKEN